MSDDSTLQPLVVRDGHGGPVTCAACGCRLEALEDGWYHYGRLGGRDARGCRIDCAEAAHAADGLAPARLPV